MHLNWDWQQKRFPTLTQFCSSRNSSSNWKSQMKVSWWT
jgi:hypothetical protein